jgi:hypothetical protein
MITTTEPTTMDEAAEVIYRLRRELKETREYCNLLKGFQAESHQLALRVNALTELTWACKRAGYKEGWLAAGGDPATIGAAEAAREADAMYGTRISGGAGRLGS